MEHGALYCRTRHVAVTWCHVGSNRHSHGFCLHRFLLLSVLSKRLKNDYWCFTENGSCLQSTVELKIYRKYFLILIFRILFSHCVQKWYSKLIIVVRLNGCFYVSLLKAAALNLFDKRCLIFRWPYRPSQLFKWRYFVGIGVHFK